MDGKMLSKALRLFDEKKYREAKTIFLSLGDKEPTAHYYLGAIYRMGLGINDDQKEAFKCFLKAAKKGHKESQYLVGCAYIDWESYHLRETELVKNDYIKTQLQSDNDSTIWQDYYPYYEIRGIGVVPNNKEGLKWISKSAQQAYPNAQVAIGDIYDSGIGVEEDIDEARKWYISAKDNGCAVASRRLAIYSFIYEEDFSKGIELLKKAHELGDSRSSFNLGKRYEKNNNVKEAFKWYKISAEKFNYFESQVKLGDLYFKGIVGKSDIKQSIIWYKKAIKSYKSSHTFGYLGHAFDKLREIKEQGYYDAITKKEVVEFLKDESEYDYSSRLELRDLYKRGFDVGEKYKKLFDLLEKAELGDQQAQIQYGYQYKIGSTRDDKERDVAKEWYMDNASLGNTDSQYLLSKIYYGDEFETERLFWLKKAADNKHPRAQFEYAILTEYKHPLVSIEYMKLAAKQEVNAQIYMGYAYAHGNLVEKKYKEAYKLYQLAASKMKNIEDIDELRHINRYKFQYNAANDEAELLANQGNVDAQLYMGCLYQYGFEVKRNKDKAYYWYSIAKKQGSDEANTQLERLELHEANN